MTRFFDAPELVIATHNKVKVEEISDLLNPYVQTFFSSDALGLSDVEETGTTFEENAILKAVTSAKESGRICLADDSGFCVEAMDNEPGVYSGRFAEKNGVRDFSYAMEKIWQNIQGKGNTRAFMVSVLALAWPDGHVETVRGEVHGEIQWPPRGNKGFGYDPIFMPDGYHVTYGEMDFEEKQKISHRSQAFHLMIKKCFRPK